MQQTEEKNQPEKEKINFYNFSAVRYFYLEKRQAAAARAAIAAIGKSPTNNNKTCTNI